MNKDDNRIFFYGFVVGTVLMVMPVPRFFFWRGVLDHVESLYRYVGFIFFVICGVVILARVIRTIIKK
jgi:putative Mn2+ efflux pump MntP